MSAAATAAGYLYASGRLRGRRDGEEGERRPERKESHAQARRKEIRVAVLPERSEAAVEKKVRRVPKIEYRTRRWRPEGE
jgi:hypothetical protein